MVGTVLWHKQVDMPKYFVSEDLYLNKETEHHLKRVLRVKIGESIILCDGKNYDYHMKITNTNPLELKLERKVECTTELKSKIILYQALPKSDKLEWVTQKTVELGVYKIIPIITEHCDVRPNLNKIARYQKIAEAAAGQSMRGIIPKIDTPITLNEAVQNSKQSTAMLVAHEKATINFNNYLKDINLESEIGVWIGPEGGFSQKEINTMEQSDFKIVSLGSRILRTETAAIATIAILQAVIE